ncbi:MAG: ECF transporter S component [Clostridiales bacterium]|nr:ECF transporter S component [Clostridiales bacterium]
MSTASPNLKRLVGMAILIALIVVLQMVAGVIKVGAFSITLTLVPIVVGAAMYGAVPGCLLGLAFGAVVLMNCVSGVDPGGNMLWAANPALTACLCLFKGGAAGFCSGLMYKLVAKKNFFAGVICAAVVCPAVNTGVFIAAMILFYRETLLLWAGETHFLTYAFVALAGVNFLIELAVNIVLSPAVIRVLKAAKKL